VLQAVGVRYAYKVMNEASQTPASSVHFEGTATSQVAYKSGVSKHREKTAFCCSFDSNQN